MHGHLTAAVWFAESEKISYMNTSSDIQLIITRKMVPSGSGLLTDIPEKRTHRTGKSIEMCFHIFISFTTKSRTNTLNKWPPKLPDAYRNTHNTGMRIPRYLEEYATMSGADTFIVFLTLLRNH
ncbi:hypothetical protein T10_12243 [Trichinella papuae]|uniref:Uncharacterized protein n=1 Tax=Trichinella papuae TaxID=268474 RepID=A0A0V1M4C9_9BILA|nr:hypothetical protein T10_12243 [Trichinella papuae]